MLQEPQLSVAQGGVPDHAAAGLLPSTSYGSALGQHQQLPGSIYYRPLRPLDFEALKVRCVGHTLGYVCAPPAARHSAVTAPAAWLQHHHTGGPWPAVPH